MNGLCGLRRLGRVSLGLLVAFGTPAVAQPPDVPLPPETIPGAGVAPPCPACENPPAQPATPKPPERWHGYKPRVLPVAPPGSFPVPPSGPGYYTLLDQLKGEKAEKPPRWPYPRSGIIPPSFHEFDFSYVDAIPFEKRDWAEKLKRIELGEHFLFSTGGEFRTRYNSETNTRLLGKNDTYQLFRGRAYTDLWYEDMFRVYAEFYYGDTIWQDVAPYARDVNRGDIQSLFVDVKVGELDGNPGYVRVGRQELVYGSQRLLSAVDWGNNRVRFEGVKGFYRSDKLDADVFATRPVPHKFGELDSVDKNQIFSGAWFTYKPKKGTFIDAYYLNLDNRNPNVAKGQFTSGFSNVSTVGGRYLTRTDDGFLADLEGAVQFGKWADQSILAQMFSANVGYYFKDVWSTPTFWVGYDYASGDPDPNKTATHRTFNQLFAFGHYYFGFTDLVGRQNINDFNVQAYAYPTEWVTTGVQYHVFRLAADKDALYNAAGAAIRRDATGASGNDVGSEIDVLVNFHLTARQDVFVSYSHFFAGDFVKRTGPSFGADYAYVQYSLRW